MATYLIDYENVKSNAFAGIEKLDSDDKIIIFYTNNSNSITFDLMYTLSESVAQIDYFKVVCGGKNALDFQLCSYLGYLIGKETDGDFYIISKDQGFDTMISFWENHLKENQKIIRSASIITVHHIENLVEVSPAELVSEKVTVTTAKPKPKKTNQKQNAKIQIPAETDLNHLLSELCTAQEIENVAEIIKKTSNKHELYLEIIKLFKQQKGLKIYKVLKSGYQNLKETVN